MRLSRAGGAEAANFNRGLFRLELAVLHPALQAVVDFMIVEFRHLPAGFADGESHRAMVVRAALSLRMGAGDKGVEALKPVYETKLHQLFQRPVNLQRRTKTLIPQLVEDHIGAERLMRV